MDISHMTRIDAGARSQVVDNSNVIREQYQRALRRIHDRTYGICDECSRPIIKDGLLDETPGNAMCIMTIMADSPPATETTPGHQRWTGSPINLYRQSELATDSGNEALEVTIFTL